MADGCSKVLLDLEQTTEVPDARHVVARYQDVLDRLPPDASLSRHLPPKLSLLELLSDERWISSSEPKGVRVVAAAH